MENLRQPGLLEVVLPIFSFLVVMVLPFIFACWVAYRTIKGKNSQ